MSHPVQTSLLDRCAELSETEGREQRVPRIHPEAGRRVRREDPRKDVRGSRVARAGVVEDPDRRAPLLAYATHLLKTRRERLGIGKMMEREDAADKVHATRDRRREGGHVS